MGPPLQTEKKRCTLDRKNPFLLKHPATRLAVQFQCRWRLFPFHFCSIPVDLIEIFQKARAKLRIDLLQVRNVSAKMAHEMRMPRLIL